MKPSIALFALLLFMLSHSTQAGNCVLNDEGFLVVNNTEDSGPGSLREAISCSIEGSGLTIVFEIPGEGPHIIQPLQLLPVISIDNLVLDASQQSSSGIPAVIIDGSISLDQTIGLTLSGTSCSVYGIVFRAWETGLLLSTANHAQVGDAERLNVFYGNETNIKVFQSDSASILNNIVGIDPDGQSSFSEFGIQVSESVSVQIGEENSGNIIGNCGYGIRLNEVHTSVILGNEIGIDASLPFVEQQLYGIAIENQSLGNLVGDCSDGSANSIGNVQVGIAINATSDGNFIDANYIGQDLDETAFPCTIGIEIDNADFNDAGIACGNFIANCDTGIEISGMLVSNNHMRENRFSCVQNAMIVPEDAGLLQTPVITNFSTEMIAGTAAPLASIDIYDSDLLCPDLGCRPGRTSISTSADELGNWTILPPYGVAIEQAVEIHAIAHLLSGSSDFSECVAQQALCPEIVNYNPPNMQYCVGDLMIASLDIPEGIGDATIVWGYPDGTLLEGGDSLQLSLINTSGCTETQSIAYTVTCEGNELSSGSSQFEVHAVPGMELVIEECLVTLFPVCPSYGVDWYIGDEQSPILQGNETTIEIPDETEGFLTINLTGDAPDICFTNVVQWVEPINCNPACIDESLIPSISVQNQNILCPGETMILQVSEPPAGMYTVWTRNGIILEEGNDTSLSATEAGLYSCYYEDAEACASALADAINLQNFGAEFSHLTHSEVFCEEEALSLSLLDDILIAQGIFAADIRWYTDPAGSFELSDAYLIDTANEQPYVLQVFGFRACNIASPQLELIADISLSVDCSVSSIESSVENSLLCYPNPSVSGQFYIASSEKWLSVRLKNLKGQDIDVHLENGRLDLQAQPPGIYLAEFIGEQGIKSVQKLVY